MPDNQTSGKGGVGGPDAETLDDHVCYQFLVRHDPPQLGSFLRVVNADVRTWQALRYWRCWAWLQLAPEGGRRRVGCWGSGLCQPSGLEWGSIGRGWRCRGWS
jgi:hypothetical protein